MIDEAEFMTALYRQLLLREPDPDGLAGWTEALRAGTTPAQVLAALLRSDEFRAKFQGFERAYSAGASNKFIFDYSQHGEVEKLIRLLVNRSTKHSIIVDVGANGRERSNSYDLMKHWQWRGILIEANPRLLPKIHAEFNGLAFQLVHAAVSNKEGTADLHIGVNDDVSSLTEQTAANWGPTKGRVSVPLRRLGSILDELAIPYDFDVLSLDIEGEDIGVLNDLVENTPYRPGQVIIEASFNFATKSLDDQPFSAAVKDYYDIADQTVANLLLKTKQVLRY